MDKVLSARIDESVITLIDQLAYEKKLPKKRILEEAVRCYWERSEEAARIDVFEQTCGAWDRSESADTVVEEVRRRFRENVRRHQAS
jgi:hypothetical protein